MFRTIPCTPRVSCGARAPTSTRPSSRALSVRVRNATSSSGGPDLEQKFNRFVRSTQPKLESFAEDLKNSARRTYTKLDSEYDISERAAKAVKRVEETAKDVDQQYGVRRRLRSTLEQVQRAWPIWSRRLEQFSATPTGKFTLIGGVFILMSTPIFWKVVNGLMMLWWFTLPIGAFLMQRSLKKQAQQAQQAAADEAERRRNPFASIFRGSGFDAASRGGKEKGKGKKSDGPVIEAEWRSVDDK